MSERCSPIGDEAVALEELKAIEGFFEGWEPKLYGHEGIEKEIEQDGRIFCCVVADHTTIPGRWTWQLLENAGGRWRECLLAEGSAGSEESAVQHCLLALVVMLSDDCPNPLTVGRAKCDLYAD